jgi:hypothetical protein
LLSSANIIIQDGDGKRRGGVRASRRCPSIPPSLDFEFVMVRIVGTIGVNVDVGAEAAGVANPEKDGNGREAGSQLKVPDNERVV